MSLTAQQWCPTSVQVTVQQARGLRTKGKGGTNDAYALMQVGKEKFQTSVVEKSVAPVWKEEAAFDLPPPQGGGGGGTLQVHVLHRALVGPDKLLGQAVINLLQLSEDKTRNKTEWFKLLDKTGKADKDRGEVLVDIQFMRNNMTASMFDLSAAGKSRSRLGKFKDKVRGKKKESDTTSNVVPSFAQVLTDSEEEGNGDGEVAASKVEKKKKNKMKSLFSPKSNLQRNMSQSMSVLPAKNSSLSGSQSSGLNVDSSEGKKKFKFRIRKLSDGSDSKDSSSGPQKHGAAEQSNLCINGSHVYCEEPPPRTARIGSNFSLASSGHGSMEDVPESSTPSVDSLRAMRQYSPWTEEEEEEEVENTEEDVGELRREEEEKNKMENERRRKEEERVRRQEEELERLAEEKGRQEEEKNVEREKEEMVRREEAKRVRREEEEREKLAEEKRRLEQKRIEDERVRQEEEERIRRQEERVEKERRRREEEEMVRRQEEEREEKRRLEEEERRQREEEERIRMDEERAEEKRRQEEEEKDKRQERECEEKRRLEEEERRQREEEERIRMDEERAEEKRRQEEEEKVKRQERECEEKRRQEEEERRQKEEEDRIRMEEVRAGEMRRREEEEKVRRQEEEEKVRREEEKARRQVEQTLAEEKGRLEAEERRKIEEEKYRKEEKERVEEERRRQEEEELVRRQEEELKEQERKRREEEEKIREEKEKAKREKEEFERLLEEKRKLEDEERKRIEAEERIRREEEERIRVDEEERVRKQEEEREQLAEEKRMLEEQERRRIEKEERKQREEEEAIRKEEEEERARKEKEEYERLVEEKMRQQEEERRMEEEESIRRKEKAENERKEEEARQLEKEKTVREAEEQKDNKTKHKAAGKKPRVAVESPSEVPSTNPFDENFSSNPFEEIPDSSTARGSTVPKRVEAAASSTASKPVSTERERRPAPQPPGRNQAESLREQDGSTRHLGQIDKKSNDRDTKTVSVLPQRSVQMITPLSRTPADTKNTQSSSCATEETSNVAKHSKRPAPSRPGSVEEGPSPEHKTAASSKGNISQQRSPEAKQVPIVHGLNPFEDDEDEDADADKDAASQTKIKSSKARAPPLPAKKASTGVTDDGVTHLCDPESKVVRPVQVQEAPPHESQAAAAGEEAVRKKLVPPVTLRRLQPVKPLNPLEQQSVSVIQGGKSTGILCEVQEKTKVNDTSLKGPYSQLTQGELIALVLKQEKQLSERDKKMSELELYIDNLLVRVMEEKPSILMSLNALKKAA